MLRLPENGSEYASIVGIDPGSNTVGLALLRFNLTTKEIHSTWAYTLTCDRLMRSDWISVNYGDRYARAMALEKSLATFFQRTEPSFIAMEAPFINTKFPAAYGVLMEVKCAIRAAVYQYDLSILLDEIDPSSIKNAIGAKGNAKKDAVKESLSKISELRLTRPVQDLDEHSIDAAAVAYTCYTRLWI